MKKSKISIIALVLMLSLAFVGCSQGGSSDEFDVDVTVVARDAASGTRGAYAVSRPFLLVTKGSENELVRDFLGFTESVQGQEITNDMNFIGAVDSPVEYTPSGMSGTIKIAGSTSVTPLIEKLQEAYQELNPDVVFELQANGSSQGINAAMDGSYDIGMASRELKDEEAAELNRHVLAIDGIAVIVNNENPKSDLASEDITNVYTGGITKWSEFK